MDPCPVAEKHPTPPPGKTAASSCHRQEQADLRRPSSRRMRARVGSRAASASRDCSWVLCRNRVAIWEAAATLPWMSSSYRCSCRRSTRLVSQPSTRGYRAGERRSVRRQTTSEPPLHRAAVHGMSRLAAEGYKQGVGTAIAAGSSSRCSAAASSWLGTAPAGSQTVSQRLQGHCCGCQDAAGSPRTEQCAAQPVRLVMLACWPPCSSHCRGAGAPVGVGMWGVLGAAAAWPC